MVRLPAEIKRGFLTALYIQGPTSTPPVTLYGALTAFLLSGFSGLQTGRLVVSHAGSGKNTVFQFPRIDQSFRQEEVFGMAQEFLETYQDAIVTLALPGIPMDASQDASIYATMLEDDRLQEITRTQPDFTTLLSPWT